MKLRGIFLIVIKHVETPVACAAAKMELYHTRN
jgi:hypothetical protein